MVGQDENSTHERDRPSVEPGSKHPPDVVPGERPQPTNQPIDDEVVSEPLEDEEGREYRVAQENVGGDEQEGSGEWPHPETPARSPAPGSTS